MGIRPFKTGVVYFDWRELSTNARGFSLFQAIHALFPAIHAMNALCRINLYDMVIQRESVEYVIVFSLDVHGVNALVFML